MSTTTPATAPAPESCPVHNCTDETDQSDGDTYCPPHECSVDGCPERGGTYDDDAEADFCSEHRNGCDFQGWFGGCDERFGYGDGIRDDTYCSKQCWWREQATGLIEGIQRDHRYCASCHRKIRDVHPPARRLNSAALFADGPDDPQGRMNDVPDCAIGFATPRPGTIPGLAESLRPRDPTAGDWESVPDDSESLRMVCECGATHHQTVNRPLYKDELIEAAKRLSTALDARLEEGKHEWHHDFDVLLNEVRETKEDPDDKTRDQRILIDALAEALGAWSP